MVTSETGSTLTGTGGLPERPLVLVTHSSGLVGGRMCSVLGAEYDVIGIDREPPHGRGGGEWIRADLADERQLADVLHGLRGRGLRGVASVVHLAAHADPLRHEPGAARDERDARETRHLLRALRAFDRVEQLVLSSRRVRSEDRTTGVILAEHGGIPYVVLRISGVYDEDTHSPPLARQMRCIYEHRIESHFVPGARRRGCSFVHLDDLAQCVRAVVDVRGRLAPRETLVVCEPDVVGHGEMRDAIAHEIHGHGWATIGIPTPLARAGAWLRDKLPGGDPLLESWAEVVDVGPPPSARQAHDALDWKPHKRLRETLPEMARRLVEDPVGWYRENGLEPPAWVARRP